MMSHAFAETVVEDAARAWLDGLGYAVQLDPLVVPGEATAEREDYSQVVLGQRLCIKDAERFIAEVTS